MEKFELALVQSIRAQTTTVSASELLNQTDRILVAGFNRDASQNNFAEGETFTVCLEEGQIVRYAGDSICSQETWEAWELVPSQSANPDACDYEFAAIMATKGAVATYVVTESSAFVLPIPTAAWKAAQ